MLGPVAAASETVADEAALRALADGGNAVDAVLAGFLGAAAHDPTALLSPMVALVGGLGVGARCVDGRACQPGRGLARPRGVRVGEAVPTAAFAAVPRTAMALAVLHAYGASQSLSAHARRAAVLARKHGAPRRAAVLGDLGRRGARLFSTGELGSALLREAGSARGGLLSEADLVDNLPGDHRLELRGEDGAAVAVPPFEPTPAGDAPALRRAQVIVAADINGLVAALCYAPDPDGIELASVELRLPTGAVPVRRGVARITPGTPLPMATPVAVLARSSDGWFAALAARAAQSLPAAALFLHRDSLPQIAANVREQLGSDVALAASVRKRRTQLVRA